MANPRLLKTVFDWDYFNIYLSGPIDFAHDGGKGWRQEWIQKLCEIGVRPEHIIDPCNKPLAGAHFNLDDEAKLMREHRANKDWEQMYDIMSQIVHIDLRFVDLSSLILVNFPQRGCEQIEEQTRVFDRALSEVSDQGTTKRLSEAFYQVASKLCDLQVPTYGTIHEIVVARQQRKPVMIVWEGGRERCSGWIQWLVGPQNVFAYVDDLIAHLATIARGETAYNANDWLLLNLSKR